MSVATRPYFPSATPRSGPYPTIWGMSPLEIHDQFWLAHGVQVVRAGERAPLAEGASWYLLVDRRALAIFDIAAFLKNNRFANNSVINVLIRDTRDLGYREVVHADDEDRFVAFQRVYRSLNNRSARMALTRDRTMADSWQRSLDTATAWRGLRTAAPRPTRATRTASGYLYDRHSPVEVMQFVRDLVQVWKRPELRGQVLYSIADGVWAEEPVVGPSPARFFGPVWIGCGRQPESGTSVIGPAVLWDEESETESSFHAEGRRPEEIDAFARSGDRLSDPDMDLSGFTPEYPTDHWQVVGRRNWMSRAAKRGFDIVFSLVALAITLPFYPLVMLLIWLEDGRPFFFGHRREGMNGVEFLCWKFRSMRRDAEDIKAKLHKLNKADGPQFFIEEDPRLTVVGKWLRKLQVDEWPQFLNVLIGDMSVVGPRPSPYAENQFCPAWREARLSVRPGITGLWQILRSRAYGLDFQEWIRYDILYVENRSMSLDFWVIWKSIALVARSLVGRFRAPAPLIPIAESRGRGASIRAARLPVTSRQSTRGPREGRSA